MRAELPWNVAGIPPEAREAARTAARREGLSVGEWLTRRILRSLSGIEEELQPAAPVDSWGLPQSAASRRDTEEMLAHVSRTETESSDLSRRIEEQLRSVARRLDSTERSQSENNRVMSKTASEINIATREQSQAFDQLASHVVAMGDRLERLERSSASDSVKEAVKALHQGLSRLADQITQTANQSATQVSSLAGNMEQLATRLGELRAEGEDGVGLLEQRVAAIEKLSQLNYNALDHARSESEEADRALAYRTDVVEKALHHNIQLVDQLRTETDAGKALAERVAAIEEAARNAGSLEQRVAAMEEAAQAGSGAVEQRVVAVEKAWQSNTNALDHALERLEAQGNARAGDLAEAQKRETQTEVALMRLEENISRLENKIPDAGFDRRLDGIDRSLTDIVQRIEKQPSESLEESVRALTQRIESLDKQHQELLSEFHASHAAATATTTPSSVGSLDLEDIFAPQPSHLESHAEPAAFEAPPFVEPPPVAPFGSEEFDSAPGFNHADPFAGGFAPDNFATPAFSVPGHETGETPVEDTALGGENFLTAARRSAQAAAQADVARSAGPFNWRREHQAEAAKPRARYLVSAILVFLLLLAVAASFVLNQRMKAPPVATPVSKPLAPPKATATVTPPASTPAPQSENGAESAANVPTLAAPSTPARTAPTDASAANSIPVAPALVSKPAPVKTEAAKPVTPAAGATISPGDRLAKLAEGGNATAQTILGIRYLDGQGGPVDMQQAGKWLLKAASQNQAVAQYRLGTMYERGQGTQIDMARAAKWYQSSANLGNRKAMYNLAVSYTNGAMGKNDMVEAARWFSKAASLGLSDSQFNLAILYERGDGVQQSLIDAFKWYAIAAGQGDTGSKQRLSQLQTQLSDADRAAAQKSAADFRAAPLNRVANVPPEMSDLPKN